MTGKVFIDSNVLVYAHDLDAGSKQAQAAAWLKRLWNAALGRLSTQVLQEFYVNVTRKIKRPLDPGQAREVVRSYSLWVESFLTPGTVIRASEISEAWQLSFWDGMIVAAAEQDGASELLSEGFVHGRVIAGVRVRNPFQG